MLMSSFSILDGIPLALLSMLIVFVILILLAVIISLLKLLPSKQESGGDSLKPAAIPQLSNDAEEELVAMLAASCLAKEELKGDVRIISIERTK